jgi:hypothetical protein
MTASPVVLDGSSPYSDRAMNIVAVKTRDGEQKGGGKEAGNLNNELVLTWDRKANCFDPSKVQTVLLRCPNLENAGKLQIRKLLGGTIETKIRSELPFHTHPHHAALNSSHLASRVSASWLACTLTLD